MGETRNRGRVLADHKRVGKRLIPPILQLPNVIETSFRDKKLPDLVWFSTIFNRCPDRVAVHKIIGFLKACHAVLGTDKVPSLVFLSNFNKLTPEEKTKLLVDECCRNYMPFLRDHLSHQVVLFETYPLSFMVPDPIEDSKSEAIHQLKADVENLLDRCGRHTTKVQVTALVAMGTTGKLQISGSIDLPDPNTIFIAPDSAEARHIASFARAMLNADGNLDIDPTFNEQWSRDFWTQSFSLEGCS